jgi:hypothetical protein
LDDWIYCTFYIHNSGLQVIQRYRWITHITVHRWHALGFAVFTSRVLATELQLSHCHLKSHMKPSFRPLIPFLPLFCNCQFRRLDSIQFLCSQAHILAGWRLKLYPPLYYVCCLTLLYNHFARTTQKITASVVKEMCLLIRRLAMSVPTVTRVASRGNVFTESLPSSGYTCYDIRYAMTNYSQPVISCATTS